MREYCLYLDESGDFDSDLTKYYRNECLVGGFLAKKSTLPDERAIRNRLIDAWKVGVPAQSDLPRNVIFEKLKHATELDPSDKVRAVKAILDAVQLTGEFVVFENYRKNSILNSTFTYANIMADGIVQLLTALALENMGNIVKLNIVAGYRRDMTVKETAYIDLEVLKSRIEERIRLAEIKNQSLKSLGAEYTLKLDNDKTSPYLVMCDYVCHFYFKRNDSVYNVCEAESNDIIGQTLMTYYHSNRIFNLGGSAEKDRVLYGITGEAYGNLLFDAAAGLIEDKKNIDAIINAFCKLPEQTRKIHLAILSSRYKEVVGNKRDLGVAEKILDFSEYLLEEMKRAGVDDVRFRMEIILYQLAIANHRGQLTEMENLFEKVKRYLPALMTGMDNMDFVFMFINRYAVWLIDNFEVEKAYNLLEKTVKQFEAYELLREGILSEVMPDMAENVQAENVRMDQKARLLGTQVMAANWMMRQGKFSYEFVASISDEAIRNFTTESDRCRQYQSRAAVEGYQGNLEEAFRYLLMGFGIDQIQKLIVNRNNSFALYHISVFYKNFADRKTREVEDAGKLLKNYSAQYLDDHSYPAFLTAGNMAEALAISGAARDMVKKYYRSSFESSKEDEPVLKILKWMLRCEYVEWLKKINDQEAASEEFAVTETAEALLAEGLSASMETILRNFLESREEDRYAIFSQMRQY